MKFEDIGIDGVFLITSDKHIDERGFFGRLFDKTIFEKHGLCTLYIQWSLSHNEEKGTIRGIHYQENPFEEEKLVYCVKGRIFDVLIDLRKNSTTYSKSISMILDSQKPQLLYVPKGIAHGFQTLDKDTDIFYSISEKYTPKSAKGIRWNDNYFKIDWPIVPPINISNKDNSYENFIL